MLSAPRVPLTVCILPEFIAESDHKMVIGKLPIAIAYSYGHSTGRVMWASAAEWDFALDKIAPLLSRLEQAVAPLATDPVLAPNAFGGTAPPRTRRKLLDAAAWCRDVLL
eukprot:5583339-Pyramimonas_sp.AAC.1